MSDYRCRKCGEKNPGPTGCCANKYGSHDLIEEHQDFCCRHCGQRFKGNSVNALWGQYCTFGPNHRHELVP